MLAIGLFGLYGGAYAATTSTAPPIGHPATLPGPEESVTASNEQTRDYFINSFAPTYIGGFIGIMGGIAFMMVVISGIQYLTSYGNEEKIKQATKSLTFSIIGFLLSLLSWSIVSIVSNVSFGGQPDREVGAGTATGEEDSTAVKSTTTE